MDKEWPVAGKTNVSECEWDAKKPSFGQLKLKTSVSSHLNHCPCVVFPDGGDSHILTLAQDFTSSAVKKPDNWSKGG